MKVVRPSPPETIIGVLRFPKVRLHASGKRPVRKFLKNNPTRNSVPWERKTTEDNGLGQPTF